MLVGIPFLLFVLAGFGLAALAIFFFHSLLVRLFLFFGHAVQTNSFRRVFEKTCFYLLVIRVTLGV